MPFGGLEYPGFWSVRLSSGLRSGGVWSAGREGERCVMKAVGEKEVSAREGRKKESKRREGREHAIEVVYIHIYRDFIFRLYTYIATTYVVAISM
jgi:hypothetical protein